MRRFLICIGALIMCLAFASCEQDNIEDIQKTTSNIEASISNTETNENIVSDIEDYPDIEFNSGCEQLAVMDETSNTILIYHKGQESIYYFNREIPSREYDSTDMCKSIINNGNVEIVEHSIHCEKYRYFTENDIVFDNTNNDCEYLCYHIDETGYYAVFQKIDGKFEFVWFDGDMFGCVGSFNYKTNTLSVIDHYHND